MWPDVGVDDKFLVSLAGRMFGQRILNTFVYQARGGTGPVPNIFDLSAALAAELQEAGELVDEYLALVPTNYRLEHIWIQCIEHIATNERLAKVAFAVDEPGLLGAATQGISQLAITRKTFRTGRTQRGTIRVPVADNVANALDGLWKEEVLFAAEDWKPHLYATLTIGTGGGTTTLAPIINHGNGALNRDFLVSAEVHPEVRSQRTRVIGRGE